MNVLTSNSTQPVLDALGESFAREGGNGVVVQCDSAKVMLQRIKDGLKGDVVVLGEGAIAELAKLGIVDAATVKPFARARVGVAVKAGAPHPDISTVEAFKRTLLNAKSVAHTVHGASGMYAPVLFERLGIAAEIRAKTVTRPGGFIGVVVASGEAEIAVQQISELLAVPGIELVGPLPDDIQKVFVTSSAIFGDAGAPPDARKLLQYFSEPRCAGVFETKGLEAA
ncbi:MAG TPA: substrate-binding domain-containing protein [Burkholderiales bacterium]|nr:substrate-binding domain-containing protein [Burkholderiales bacterium]